MISWTIIVEVFIIVAVVLLVRWALRKLRRRKILNPLPKYVGVGEEDVENEGDSLIDQTNLTIVTESKTQDLTAEKK